ncbi:hypothetical protein M125_3761 [Bacteroides fragilis str. 3998T(B)3]|uniref:Uncharacterized protein n=1 Tax=Bacteroides fragilis str. 3998T(B)3 TaxID=1339316 RepID=A0A015VU96_BACFG|nr:hypothetical protein M101_3199 [Bacteroides fragilis str. 1007-1-F \
MCFVVLYHDIRLDADKSERLQPKNIFFFVTFPQPAASNSAKNEIIHLKTYDHDGFYYSPFNCRHHYFRYLQIVRTLCVQTRTHHAY